MYISTCWIYDKVELSVRADGRTVYLGLGNASQDIYMNITLDRTQIKQLSDGLTEALNKAEKEEPDDLCKRVLERSAA